MANEKAPEGVQNSFAGVIKKFSELAESYAPAISTNSLYSAFSRAAMGLQNMPQIQNARVKGISALPADYTKDQIGDFLRNPYFHERELRQTSEILKWTSYSYFKLVKTYADIPTYRYYTAPRYLTGENIKSDAFKREATLVDKFCREFEPERLAHEAVGKALTLGKVFYTYRYEIDKSHNQVRYALWQQLPSEYLWVIGKNSTSGWTVSFDLMYFLQPGTDVHSFGDLFDPYLDDFNKMFEKPETKTRQKTAYSEYAEVDCKGHKLNFYPSRADRSAVGHPNVFMQNGRWMYYVSLPADKVFGFEIDDTTANVASPLSGLMLTYSQQSDYEAAQLSLLLNPLIKFLTGEIDYRDSSATAEDQFKLSLGARAMFESFFNALMADTNTGGTAFYTAPVKNIKSHDFAESSSANEISESYNRYGMEKAGLAGLIPVSDDVKASQVNASMKIEGRFSTATIYPQIEKMMRVIFNGMNLNYEWDFTMFGDIFSEEETREAAQKALDIGDTSALFVLSALDGSSWLDKLTKIEVINASGIMEKLKVPQTAYTQSGGATAEKSTEVKTGRPESDEITDVKEKTEDTGGGDAE